MRYRSLGVLLAVLILLASCASGPPELASDEKKDALAQEFMAELRDEILPLRNQTDRFYQMGVVTVREDGVLGEDLFDDFVVHYNAGRACAMTVAFTERKPMVISKYVFAGDGTGYYFRYELEEDSPIAVTGKPVNQIAVAYDADTSKTTLTISHDKETVSTLHFSFYDTTDS